MGSTRSKQKKKHKKTYANKHDILLENIVRIETHEQIVTKIYVTRLDHSE